MDGESDPAIALLANEYNCPVLSEDSDYYIFDLNVGYIPLSSLKITSKPIQCSIYVRNDLCREYGVNSDLCLAIPAILGNDFIPSLMAEGPLRAEVIRLWKPEGVLASSKFYSVIQVGQVIQFLSKFRDFDELTDYTGRRGATVKNMTRSRIQLQASQTDVREG